MKRILLIKRIVNIIFVINMILSPLNRKILNGYLNEDLVSYMFWFAIGLYIGFQWYHYEINKIMKVS